MMGVSQEQATMGSIRPGLSPYTQVYLLSPQRAVILNCFQDGLRGDYENNQPHAAG